MNNFKNLLENALEEVNISTPIRGGVANLNTRDEAIEMGKEAHNVGIGRNPKKDSDFRKLSKGLKGKELKYLTDGWLEGWHSASEKTADDAADRRWSH